MDNKQVVQVECRKCNGVFLLEEITLKKIVVNREKEYLLTYYQCPRCGCYFTVLVEDEQSLEAQKVFEGYKTKIRVLFRTKSYQLIHTKRLCYNVRTQNLSFN